MYNFFPATVYQDVLITDTLRRFKFSERFKKSVAVQNYRIKEEDTPESLSYLLYGDTTFSWMILLVNDMLDRNNDWPLTQRLLVNKINDKYNTSAVFLRDSDICNQSGCFQLSDVTRFVVNGDEYLVKSVDRNLNKIVTTTKIDYTAETTDNVSFYNGNTLLKNTQLRRVVYDDSFSLNYFEDDDGIRIDPRSAIPNNPEQEEYTYLRQYVESTDIGQKYVVTNFDYENKQNDIKRDIVLVLPEYKNSVVNSISRMFLNGITKNSNALELDILQLIGEA